MCSQRETKLTPREIIICARLFSDKVLDLETTPNLPSLKELLESMLPRTSECFGVTSSFGKAHADISPAPRSQEVMDLIGKLDCDRQGYANVLLQNRDVVVKEIIKGLKRYPRTFPDDEVAPLIDFVQSLP